MGADNSTFIYRGWKVIWTGWKKRPDAAELCGQWLAVKWGAPSDTSFLMSSYPGLVGKCERGSVFNLAPTQEQKDRGLPTPLTSPLELELYRLVALDLLLRFIRESPAEEVTK